MDEAGMRAEEPKLDGLADLHLDRIRRARAARIDALVSTEVYNLGNGLGAIFS